MTDSPTLALASVGASSWALVPHLAPALVLVFSAVSLVVAFAVRGMVRGQYWDEQVAGRGSTVLVGMWLRQCFAWGMQPVLSGLFWVGLPAAALTVLSLFLAIGAGAAIAVGWMTLGGVLFVASGICDFLDGRVARHQGTAGPRGALLDSVIDRYVEAIVFAGLAWYYRGTWVLAVVLAATAGSSLVPYVRARGEALGVPFSNVGIVQRPERIVILGASLLTSSIVESMRSPRSGDVPHRVIVAGLVILAVSTFVSSLQRFVYASRALAPHASTSPLAGAGALASKNPVAAVAGAVAERVGRTAFGRGSLVRNAGASALATVVDFSLVLAMVEWGRLHPVLATALGCFGGAVVNFSVNRFWVFQRRRPTWGTAARYAFVSLTSAGLNSGLLAVLLLVPLGGYSLLWWVVRGCVYVLWNYPLHRDYVFEPPRHVVPVAADSPNSESADSEVDPRIGLTSRF